MEFIFEGFTTSLHWLVIALLFVLCVAFSWYTYHHLTGIQSWRRYVLIGLRSTTFILLLLILLDPSFLIEEATERRSEVAVIFDQSQSVTIEKGDYDGLESYQQIWDALDLTDTTDVRFRTYAFDRDFYPAHPDTMNWAGSGTNISNALSEFQDIRDHETAVIFISDGIYNTGRDPSWQASRFPIPIYSVAIGDTSRVQDIVVQDVIYNETGYTNTRSPISTSILNDGLPGEEVTVQLRHNNEVIEEKSFTSNQQRSVTDLRFEIELEEEGLQQYEIFVPEVEGEWTTENNSRSFNINVIDDQLNIMVLSFEIHPDLRSIRSILREDQSIELDYRTWLGNERFIEGEFPDRPDTLDLVILQGFPQSGMSSTLQNIVEEFISGKPLLWLSAPKTDLRMLGQVLGGRPPIRASQNADRFDVRLAAREEEQSHPIMELPEINHSNTPTLSGPIRNITTDGNVTTLFNANYQGTTASAPLITLHTLGNTRSSWVTAHGWYRWYLSNNDDIRSYTIELMNNLVKWTATSDDEPLLQIQPTRTIFEEAEPVAFNAFLNNESGEAEDDAIIDLTLTGDEISERNYSMSNEGLGKYRLQAGNLPRGFYRYEARAHKNNREIDSRSGEFSVGSTNLEFINTVRNDELLQYMARESGGYYYSWQDADQLRSQLQEDGLFNRQTFTTTREIRAYQHPLWFILLLLTLTTEWIIRKVSALP